MLGIEKLDYCQKIDSFKFVANWLRGAVELDKNYYSKIFNQVFYYLVCSKIF